MFPDLTRPPSRLGPRHEGWVTWSLILVLSFVGILVAATLTAGHPNGLGAVFIILVFLNFSFAGLGVSTFRLGVYHSRFRQWRAARGAPFGDPERGRSRVADRDEIAASRRLRRRRISRIQYERVIAYRRFVHGELTKTEYHQVLDFLSFHESHPSRSARPNGRAQ